MKGKEKTSPLYWFALLALGLLLGVASLLLSPHDVATPPKQRGEAQKELDAQLRQLDMLKAAAVRLAANGHYAEALIEFIRLNYININDPFAYQRMGSMVEKMGPKAFEELLATTLTNRPDEKEIDRIYGGALYYAKKYSLAIDALKRFYAIDANNFAGRFLYGATLHALGKKGEAKELLLALIKDAPSHHFAYIELQQIYDAEGNDAESHRMLGLALKTNPINKKGICCGLSGLKKKGEVAK